MVSEMKKTKVVLEVKRLRQAMRLMNDEIEHLKMRMARMPSVEEDDDGVIEGVFVDGLTIREGDSN